MIVSLLLLLYIASGSCYTVENRFGHSAVLFNDSIYFYGGDNSISSIVKNQSEWLSDLAVLPIRTSYQLTDPPWKPASGPQSSVGGPSVYSHVAFMGGTNNGNMIILSGVMPQTDKFVNDEEPMAYSYDCDLGRWNAFSLPSGNQLNRQGAACTITDHGIAYIWGGKRATVNSTATNSTTKSVLSASMYRFDSVYFSNSSIVTSSNNVEPPLRYAHTQTLISDHRIVVLGGFDGATGDAISLADVWLFDINTSTWSQINAKLEKENKPANRSSHSQVLMPDGYSILVYGGYDGYHVYNDVAVLDTRTWTWTVKNTNAALQGRADHTATLVNTNMIVAFGFTGVSTALTVMSDIEVLDTVTWSWTSVYTPSDVNSIGGGNGNSGNIDDIHKNNNMPGSPSTPIIAGAVTGGLVVFILILVAFHLLDSYHHKKRLQQQQLEEKHEAYIISNSSSISSNQQQTRRNMKFFQDPPSATEPFEYHNQKRRPSAQTPHPLQITIPTRSDTIDTHTTTQSSSFIPSPWSHVPSLGSMEDKEVFIKRGPSVAKQPPIIIPYLPIATSISKPDDILYPTKDTLKRAATLVGDTSSSHHYEGSTTNNSSTVTITHKNIGTILQQQQESRASNLSFDRQEFVLNSDEVEKSADKLLFIYKTKPTRFSNRTI